MTKDVTRLLIGDSFGALRQAAVELGLGPILLNTKAEEINRDLGDGSLDDLLAGGESQFAEIQHFFTRRRILESVRQLLLRELRTGGPPPPVKGKRPRGEKLELWAHKHGVADELGREVANLRLPELPYRIFGRITLRDLLNGDQEKSTPRALKAAWRYLQRRAGAVRAALDEEKQRDFAGRPRPEEPAIASLIDRLVALRTSVRESVAPRPRDSYQVLGAQLTDSHPVRFEYTEPFSSNLGPLHVEVTVALPFEGAPQLKCSECRLFCTHGLSALDALLEIAFGMGEPEARSTLVERFARAPWERTLSMLDDALDALDDESETPALLWWLLDEARRQIVPQLQHRGRRGQLLKPKRVPVWKVPDSVLIEKRDREVLALARGLDSVDPRSFDPFFAEAARALVEHPRVLVVGGGEVPWRVERGAIELAMVETETGVALRPVLGDQALSFQALSERLDEELLAGHTLVGLDQDARVVRVVEVAEDALRVVKGLERLEVDIPKESQGPLIERLVRLSARMPVRFPEAAYQARIEAQRELVLTLLPLDELGLELSLRIRPIAGGALLLPGEGPLVAIAATPERALISAVRDFDAERAEAEALFFRLGLEHDELWRARTVTVEASLALVEKLQQEAIECCWPKGQWQTKRVGRLALRVTEQRDWFGLESGAEIDGRRVELAVLLDAARARRSYVRLDGDLYLQLEQALLDRLAKLEPHTFSKQERIEISPAAIGLLEGLGELEAPRAWRDLEERIERAGRLDPKPPASLCADLRPYQVAGHAWMSRLAAWGAGAILADDMGLGKTVQTIAMLIDRAPLGPQLVVAPTSVCFNWSRELERFAPHLRAVAYSGNERAQLLSSLAPGDVVIASYALVQRDAAAFAAANLATLVIDEAQAIKNAATKRSQALRSVKADWIVALTGTPIENRLAELWSIFRMVFPGLLGSWEHFRDRFVTPIEKLGQTEAGVALSNVIRPFVLRRSKREVAGELPPRTDITVDVALSPMERELYDDARLSALAKLQRAQVDLPAEQLRFHVLAALTRLRQLCCHPKLYDETSAVASSKLERLLHLTSDLLEEGRRALLFSQFTSHLALVRSALDEQRIPYLYLDGSTPAEDRGALIDRFQRGEAPLFLLSLKAGGTGLNLTAADTVIHLDPWWNPAVEDQATDRAHRIGQTQPVTVMRLIVRDTIEEQILALHESKRGLIQSLLEGTDRAGALDSEALIALIRGRSE